MSFWTARGAALAPMMELLEAGKLAVEALEAVLLISAEQVAGSAHPSRHRSRPGAFHRVWHGPPTAPADPRPALLSHRHDRFRRAAIIRGAKNTVQPAEPVFQSYLTRAP